MRRSRTLSSIVVILVFAAAGASCAKPTRRGAESASFHDAGESGGKPVNQVELQQYLQRFSSQFIDRLAEASSKMEHSDDPEIRENSLREALLYGTSALEIATEPSPQVALLDMVTFIELCKDRLDRYWIPKVYGDEGQPLAVAFRKAQVEIWEVADRVMRPEGKELLKSIIRRWSSENPDQIRVEGVRLADFAIKAGEIESKRAEETGGLLAGVNAAVEITDQALLFSERVLYFAQRMPSILRIQARLGTLEILSELDTATGGAHPLLKESSTLMDKAGMAAYQARRLTDSFYPIIRPHQEKLEGYLRSANQMTDSTLAILDKLQTLSMARVDAILRRFFIYLIVFAGACSVFWWSGFYLYKKALLRAQAGSRDSARKSRPRRAA